MTKNGFIRICNDKEFWRQIKQSSYPEFEDYIAKLFFKLGYRSEVVGGENDGGIDVVLSKDGVRYYVQCKRYRGASVSAAEVREFYGALTHYGTKSAGFFVTTTKFSQQAESFAEGKPIILIDGQKLVEYVRRVEK
jgi:restriction system protein